MTTLRENSDDSSRDAFLHGVRQAVAAGNRAGNAPPLPERGDIDQGAGTDPVARFSAELSAAGGIAHIVPNTDAAVAKVIELVQAKSPRQALLGRGPVVDALHLAERLRSQGVEVISVDSLTAESSGAPFFAADIGISGVDYLVAETGSVVVEAGPSEPRSVSLLPPVHIAVADRSQLVADLFDLFVNKPGDQRPELPSCLSIITGPSKTGDIELKLVTGVHGPGEIHVVLIDSGRQPFANT